MLLNACGFDINCITIAIIPVNAIVDNITIIPLIATFNSVC